MKKLLIIIILILSCNLSVAEGSFYHEDGDKYYHFRSTDDSVWWTLTEDELGQVPSLSDKYILIYNNNGTTSCTCEYPDCECYVYDDEFIAIRRITQ